MIIKFSVDLKAEQIWRKIYSGMGKIFKNTRPKEVFVGRPIQQFCCY
jgi:hypothetical protein